MSESGRESDHERVLEQAAAYGIDLSLIDANLRKTPAERLRAHDRALATALELREAVRKRHARSEGRR